MELFNGLPLEEITKIVLIANSYVDCPAIQDDFVIQFSEEVEVELEFSFDEEKRIVTGPLMIPDMKIFRKATKTRPNRYVYYTAETIKETALDFHRNGRTNNTTVNHTALVDGSVMVESWFVEDPKNDKLFALKGKEYPKGTWAVSEYISDDKTWEDVKSGKLKGFSIEGYEVRHEDEYKNENENMTLLEKLKAIINGSSEEVVVVVENKVEEVPAIVEDVEKVAMASELETLKSEKLAMETEVAKLKSDLAVLMAKTDEAIIAPKSNDKYVKEEKSKIPSLVDVMKNVEASKNKNKN
jgi:cell division protein FtsB